MDNISCTTVCLNYAEGGTCLFVELIIYADGYNHLWNLLVVLYRWMKSSALVYIYWVHLCADGQIPLQLYFGVNLYADGCGHLHKLLLVYADG